MLTLAAPWWLLLAPLPLLLQYRRRVPASGLNAAPRLPLALWTHSLASTPGWFAPRRWLIQLLLVLAWLLLLAALARPHLVDNRVSLPHTGRDLMLVVDLSPSMEERDMLIAIRALSRLEALKRLGSEFITQRAGDRLGLVVFSTTAHLYAPLTYDHRTVRDFLQDSFVGMAGGATAIGDAVGLAVKNLQQEGQGEPVIILLTDGENNAGRISPTMATELAVAAGIRVHTVGIGNPDAVDNFSGFRSLRGRAAGVDEELLQAMAEQTGGRFFMAHTMPGLEMIYQQLDALEPVAGTEERYQLRRDLYYWPLSLALLALLLTWLLAGPLPSLPWRNRGITRGDPHD
ncbi:MAG: VWA domain-containing protein [Halomonadaceae bacterium]|nr:MAG: VWA domain-containing protein [Halomonadaceae bacterium]